MRKLILLLMLVLLSTLGYAATSITSCQTISVAGDYELANDIKANSSSKNESPRPWIAPVRFQRENGQEDVRRVHRLTSPRFSFPFSFSPSCHDHVQCITLDRAREMLPGLVPFSRT